MSRDSELYSLLIPLSKDRLLVPRACVAEVISYTEPPPRENGSWPDWYIGSIDWNGRSLPLVSLDEAREESSARRQARRRIVIFHGLTEHMRGRHYGILTQGFPQLVRVNRDVLTADKEFKPPEGKPFLCRARMIHEFPLIPDVDRLEAMLADVVRRRSA